MNPLHCAICGAPLPRKLKKFCSTDCKAEWQRRQKPVDREWLSQKYLVEGLTAAQIAQIVNRDEKRVWEWLRGYGIPTRPRGENMKTHPHNKGKAPWITGRKHSEAVRERERQRRRDDGRVPYLNKDGVHHMKGKRGPETSNWKGGVTPERQGVYSSLEWVEAVKTVWRRDDAKCRRCGLDHRTLPKEERRKFHVHHIVSFAVKELRCEPSNLVLLCADCHRFVHSKANTRREFIGEEHDDGSGVGGELDAHKR